MAFNINAQIILQGPKNIKAVTKQIQKQLGGISATIKLDIPKDVSRQLGDFTRGLEGLTRGLGELSRTTTRSVSDLKSVGKEFDSLKRTGAEVSKNQAAVQKSFSKTGDAARQAGSEIELFGKDAALAIRRFTGFTLATGIVFGFVRAVQAATSEAINYERQIAKVIQVTGASAREIDGLNSSITKLSTSLGVDANKLAELARIFAQTGQSLAEVKSSLRAVARSSLAPSFGEMTNTAEGLIAALAQFNIAAKDSEAVLASINAVSKSFAVEAEDLISVIRRAGGVFSASAKNLDDPKQSLNELIGIFTAVRSTTRESAETIAVGLRTIFTRIQRRGTIEFLKQFNIELVDAKGNFIGLFPAFQELARGLNDIVKSGDALTLSAITEELGGVRQVGKLIPAITNFNKALAATKIAGEAAKAGLGKDVTIGLKPLGKQLELLQERFSALIRTITDSKTFQGLAKVALSLANAFLSVAETLTPILPLIATLAAVKISKGIFEFGKGFVGGLKKGGGAGGLGERIAGAGGGGGGAGGAGGGGASRQALATAINGNVTALNANTKATRDLLTRQQLISKQLIQVIAGLSAGGGSRPIPFAKGGPVKGPSHARGGVPAILEGGEYVIPKGYAKGGGILETDPQAAGIITAKLMEGEDEKSRKAKKGKVNVTVKDVVDYTSGGVQSLGDQVGEIASQVVEKKMGKSRSFGTIIEGLGTVEQEAVFAGALNLGVEAALTKAGDAIAATVGGRFTGLDDVDESFYEKFDKGFKGQLFEDVIKGFTGEGSQVDKVFTVEDIAGGSPFDYTSGIPQFKNVYQEAQKLKYLDAKLTNTAATKSGIFESKIAGQISQDLFKEVTETAGRELGKELNLGDISLNNKKQVGSAVQAVVGTLSRKEIERNPTKMRQLGILVAPTSAKQALKKMKDLRAGNLERIRPQNKAAGGNIFSRRGTDTVPAMLTPGEFVINKSSAQSIGYGKLKKMNRMARGGIVGGGPQYLQDGGTAGNMTVTIAGGMVEVIGVVEIGGGLDAVVTAINNVETEIGGLQGGTGSVAEKEVAAAPAQQATTSDVNETAVSVDAVTLDVAIAKSGPLGVAIDNVESAVQEGNDVLSQILAGFEASAEAAAPKEQPKEKPKEKKKVEAVEGPTAADTAEVEALSAGLVKVVDEMDRFSKIVSELKFPKNLNKDLVALTKNLKDLGKSADATGSDLSEVAESPGGAPPDTGELTQSASDAAAALQALAEAAVLATEAGAELAESTEDTAEAMDDVSTSSTEAAESAEELADSNDEAATSGADIASGLGNAVGAIGGITAAFATLDFSSAEGTISSVIALGFAVQSATAAITTLGPALGGMTGVFGRLTGCLLYTSDAADE